MDTHDQPNIDAACGQSTDSADNLRTCSNCQNDFICHDQGECLRRELIEARDALSKALDIPPGTVAVIKLPLPVKRLVALTAEMNTTFGTGLYLREHPEGWLCFFQPTKEGGDQ